MRDRRRKLLAGARGSVLEIGAGTGLNVLHYPRRLDALILAEPDESMARRLERRAARTRPAAHILCAEAEALPLSDASVDVVVSTMVLCTVADPGAAIAELRRVLRPGGRLLYIEHVRAAEPGLARLQDRLAVPWAAFAAGCRCNRPTLELLEDAFALDPPATHRWHGMPRIVQPLIVGVATRP